MSEKVAFARFHPISLFCYFAAVLLFTMFTQNPVLLALSLFGAILFCAATSEIREFIRDLKFYVPMFLIVAVTNPLFSHNGATPLFFMNDNPVTLEALLCGVDIAAMITAVMLFCKGFSKVMESDKLLCLFGTVAPKLSIVLSMSLRFIPLFKRKWREIKEAQAAMGYFREDGIVNKLSSYTRVFSALVTWALENGADTADSMSARGYDLGARKNFALFRFTKNDAALLVFTLALSAVTLCGFAAGKMDFEFYPRVTAVNANVLAIISYAAFGVLAFIPFIFEVKEALRWKYLRSKI